MCIKKWTISMKRLSGKGKGEMILSFQTLKPSLRKIHNHIQGTVEKKNEKIKIHYTHEPTC